VRSIALAVMLGCAVLPAQQKGASAFTPVNEAAYSKLISAHKGKILLVDFWATWCVPCRKETPEIVKMADRLAARGLDVVAISWDEPDQESAAIRFLKDNKVSGTPYIKRAPDDDKFAAAVDPKWSGALPALFLYDRTGKKLKTFIGETPTKDIEAAILKLL
jgi:thiol-disulfide isomerase/thioredoxin